MNSNMEISKLAYSLAQKNGLQALKYDLFLREFDNKVELIGLVNDPNYDINEFQGREMLFPKRWVTLKVFDADYTVAA